MADDGERPALDLRDYGRILWHQRWLIVLTVLVTVGVAVALSVAQTPVYEATADVIIQPSGSEQILDSTTQDASNAARNVDTETAVLRSKVIEKAAKKRLGREPDVTVTNNENSDVVNVSARSSNARRAAADANGYAAAYVAYRQQQTIDELLQVGQEIQKKIEELDGRIDSLATNSPARASAEQQRSFLQEQLDQLQVSANLNRVGGARVLARADVPEDPVEPQPIRNVAIAFIIGLLLGIGLAFLRDYLDDGITSREELERATSGLPILGEIPRIPGWRAANKPYVVTIEAPESPAAEAYRTLRTSIQFLSVSRELRSLQVTSATSDEGKTTTLANLAITFARTGRTVVVVCCDLRRPRIHEFFGLENKIGFTSILLGDVSAPSALQRVSGEPNFAVLSAGPPPPNPSELLSSERALGVISTLQRNADLVLLDSPPVLPVSDALIVSGMVDATLVVANARSSSRRAVHRAVGLLKQVDAPLVGAVLNGSGLAESYSVYAYSRAPEVRAAEQGSNGAGASKRDQRRAAKDSAKGSG